MRQRTLAILLILVICSTNSILFSYCDEDEFAEFDDFVSNEQQDKTSTGRDSVTASSKFTEKEAKSRNQGENDKSSQLDNEHTPSDSTSEPNLREEDETSDRQKKPELSIINAPLPRFYKWESYYIEIAFLIASILYLANFFVGSGKNHKFAQDWYEHSRDLLKQQFSLVGGAPQLNDGSQKKGDEERREDTNSTSVKKQKGLIKTTESQYTLWNSGRVGMDGLLIEINLLKRQDLFNMALNVLKPATDNLILRFLLNQDGYENFVFCLAHKTQAPKLARDLVDINTFCPKRKPLSQYGIDSERLFVMSELSDVTSFIFDQKTIAFIKKHEQSIKFIHITDQYSTVKSEDVLPAQKLANSKRMATFSFNFPFTALDRAEFILFSLSLLDRLRRFRLARDSKQKSEKNRQKINDIIQKTAFSQRQEAAQTKKEELRRLEKERIYNEDDPEKQRRWEKKEAKRELKKNKMRVKQLKVKSM